MAAIAALSAIFSLEGCKTYTENSSNDMLYPSDIIFHSPDVIGRHVAVFGFIALGNPSKFFSGHEIWDSASMVHERDADKIAKNIRCCCLNIINPSFIYALKRDYKQKMIPLSGIIVDDRDDVDNACHGQVALKIDE